MDNDVEHIYIEFHDGSRNIFNFVYSEFRHVIQRMDRKREEAKFIREKQAYVQKLQMLLSELAQRTEASHRHCTQAGFLSQNLNHFIAEYLHQFVLKANAL
jgi:hypothetical protein